jgi:hypothetical protein
MLVTKEPNRVHKLEREHEAGAEAQDREPGTVGKEWGLLRLPDVVLIGMSEAPSNRNMC